MPRVLVPTRVRVTRAMRRSRPVWVMAAAMNNAPATRASAGLEKPVSAMLMAGLEPIRCVGSCSDGAVPSKNAMSEVIMIALAS